VKVWIYKGDVVSGKVERDVQVPGRGAPRTARPASRAPRRPAGREAAGPAAPAGVDETPPEAVAVATGTETGQEG